MPSSARFAVSGAFHYIQCDKPAGSVLQNRLGATRLNSRERSASEGGPYGPSHKATRLMTNSIALRCDGCGQIAPAEHIARRLRRLEWTTRYRPVHIHTLLLGAFSPHEEKDFLYAPGGEFHGEAAHLLDALGISTSGKAAEGVHAEFQRAGFFLTRVLECPLDRDAGQGAEAAALLAQRLQPVA